jgi:hypothetical protein
MFGTVRNQASFKTSEYSSYNLDQILGDPDSEAGGDRVIKRQGNKYKMLFWAGIFKDDSSSPSGSTDIVKHRTNANPDSEMTFSYLPSPEFDPRNKCSMDLVAHITSISDNSNSGCSGGATKDPINPYRDLASLSMRYEDKAFHNFHSVDGDNNDDGGFMKLIVGVVWDPTQKGFGGAGAARALQEYYLVSFKANLSEE